MTKRKDAIQALLEQYPQFKSVKDLTTYLRSHGTNSKVRLIGEIGLSQLPDNLFNLVPQAIELTDAYHTQKDQPVIPEPTADIQDWAQFGESTLRKILPTSNLASYPAFKRLLRDHIWDNLTAAERYYALESGGVDNWGGYSDAIEAAEEDSGEDWWNLDDAERYHYLDNFGVDNWSYYSDSLQEYVNNRAEHYVLTPDDYLTIWRDLDFDQLDQWEGANTLYQTLLEAE